jgi:hypothetical protein
MLISPTLLHVKTGPGADRREFAVVGRARLDRKAPLIEGMTAEAVLDRLDAPVMTLGPEATEWRCVRQDHAAMAARGEWPDLLDALRFADQDRSMASGGQRVAPLISQGVRGRLVAAIGREDLTAAMAELARFQAIHDQHPDDYAAAHLLAEALIDLGLMKQGKAAQGQLSRDLSAESAAHFAAAERLIDRFDPIEEMSPLLAGTRYRLVRGIEDGRDLCRDWFEDWCDLDPQDATIHVAHALNMLPDWFGSLAGFEREARRAATMTRHVSGWAAYAVFHMTARDRLGDLAPTIDLVLFLRGLHDYQVATGCQHRANVAAGLLTELALGYRQAGPDCAYQLTKVRTALSEVLWTRLHEVHLESWPGGSASLAFALSEAFGPALQRGARIARKGQGLGTRVPRQR